MAITVTHPFVSAIADDPAAAAAGEVVPSNWNAAHTVTGIDSPSNLYVTESGTIGTKLSAIATASTFPTTTDTVIGVHAGTDVQFTGLQLFQSLVSQGLRSKLLGPTTVYVSPSGSDAVPFVANSALNPWKTLLHAWNVMCGSFDMGGQVLTIKMADGTYTDNIIIGGPSSTTNLTPIGGGTIIFEGNSSTPLNVIWNGGSTWNFSNWVLLSSAIEFSDMLVENTAGSGNSVILPAAYANYTMNSVSYGTAGSSFIQSIAPSNVAFSGGFTFTGATLNVSPFLAQVAGAIINMDAGGVTVTATGVLDWSGSGVGFIQASSGANAFGNGMTFTTSGGGSYVGSRYTAAQNGVITVFGAGGNYFPGSTAGTAVTGGIYA